MKYDDMDHVDRCAEMTSITKIVVKEHKSVATISNDAKEKFVKIKVDDCLQKKGVRCDWLICKDTCGDLAIELKGTDVVHAIEQIKSTMTYWASMCSNRKMAGLVVCRQYPKIDTKIQRSKQELQKRFKAKLTVVSRNMEHDFCSLFS